MSLFLCPLGSATPPYLDDVIVFGHMEEEHLECLHVIFK